MSALEILLFLVSAYYLIRMILRAVLPMLFQGLVNKAQQQYGQQKQYRQNAKHTNDTVRVDKIPDHKSSIPDSEGDYIDYEEIK